MKNRYSPERHFAMSCTVVAVSPTYGDRSNMPAAIRTDDTRIGRIPSRSDVREIDTGLRIIAVPRRDGAGVVVLLILNRLRGVSAGKPQQTCDSRRSLRNGGVRSDTFSCCVEVMVRMWGRLLG